MISRSTWQGLKLTVKLTDLRKKKEEKNLMKTVNVIGAKDKKKIHLASSRHGNRTIGLITVSTLFVIGKGLVFFLLHLRAPFFVQITNGTFMPPR